MGGLKSELPITYWTFLVGALAIAGVPGLAGFFSKDEILFRTFASGHTVLWIVGLLTSLLTAVYMFRLVFLAFHGELPRHPAGAAQHPAGHGSTRMAPPAPWHVPTCTMPLRRWRSRWSCSRSARCSPATSACRTRSAARTGSSSSWRRASRPARGGRREHGAARARAWSSL